MLYIDIRTQKNGIGRIEVLNLMSTIRGKTRYDVKYILPNGIVIGFKVLHRRDEGAIKLLQIICRHLVKQMDEFFSVPKDKIVDGAIRCRDIPERYVNEFSKHSPVNTGTMIDGESALFVSDIESWCRMMRTGAIPIWD